MTYENLSENEKIMGMVAHLLGIVSGPVGALVLWMVNKDKPEAEFSTEQAKEALNFQLTIFVGYIISIILTVIIIGAITMMGLWIVSVVFSIIGGLKAKEGEDYRYPFAVRLVK